MCSHHSTDIQEVRGFRHAMHALQKSEQHNMPSLLNDRIKESLKCSQAMTQFTICKDCAHVKHQGKMDTTQCFSVSRVYSSFLWQLFTLFLCPSSSSLAICQGLQQSISK